MFEYARSLAEAFRNPVLPDVRRHLDAAWQRVPVALRTPNQFLGRQYAGCGATIGAMPRCDFACVGCYLGEGANRIPPAPLDEVKRQLRALRAWLGPGGNVQLTDGELTLRDTGELIEMVRYARRIGLVPMLMTHGDAFRRHPSLLSRLMVEGGLTEMSLHVDTTQRGRRGAIYKNATREEELDPLREELAEMIRQARRQTRRKLDVATTFTVTRDNLEGVSGAMRWIMRHADAFKMISFQPVAQVGRTAGGLGGSAPVDRLWSLIAEGLLGPGADPALLLSGEGLLGHPGCSRFVQGVVVRDRDREPTFHPLFRGNDGIEQEALRALVEELGGLTFRLDDRWHALARAAGIARRSPRFVIRRLPRLAAHWLRRFAPDDPLGLAWRCLRGEARVDYLNVVSHHFMSREEIATPLGRERLDLCVFQVPIGDRLVSMCEVNALGLRERYYETLGGSAPSARTAA